MVAMENSTWYSHYTVEIEHGRSARAAGNEGMARVCARRAVGWVLGEYFRRHGFEFSDPSAYEKVNYLLQLEGVPADVKEVAAHFNLRITPEHQLPVEADLLAEAEWLKSKLLDIST